MLCSVLTVVPGNGDLSCLHASRSRDATSICRSATTNAATDASASGQLDALLASCGRFCQHVSVLDTVRRCDVEPSMAVHIRPALVFGRLWDQLGLPQVIERLLGGRKFEFPMERAIFITVLHRLMVSGSDQSAGRWYRRYAIDGQERLELYHFAASR